MNDAELDARTKFADEHWAKYLETSPVLISGEQAHALSYSFGVLVGQDFARVPLQSRIEAYETAVREYLDALDANDIDPIHADEIAVLARERRLRELSTSEGGAG